MSYPQLAITNSLAFDLDAYDQYSDSDGNITYTKLGTVSANSTGTITTKHQGSVVGLVRSGIISAFSSTEYYVDFPVATLNITALDSSFAYTIDADDQKGMEQALQFFKYISANPLGTTATNFKNLLSNETASTLETDVNAYFAALSSYSKCNLTAWTNVNLWLNREFSPWQEAKYYLYTTTGTISEKATASISIASNGTATATLTDTSSGSTTNIAISDGTITEQNVGSGSVSVSLTPTFTYVNSVISPVLTGTVNGVSVLGTKKKQDTSSSSSSNSGFSDASIVSISIGAAFLLFTLGKEIHSWWSNRGNGNEADADAANAELNDNLESLTNSINELNNRVTSLQETLAQQRADDVNSELDAQSDMVREEMEASGSSDDEIDGQIEEIQRMRADSSSVTNEELRANRADIESNLEVIAKKAGTNVSDEMEASETEAENYESEEEAIEEEQSISDDGTGTDTDVESDAEI